MWYVYYVLGNLTYKIITCMCIYSYLCVHVQLLTLRIDHVISSVAIYLALTFPLVAAALPKIHIRLISFGNNHPSAHSLGLGIHLLSWSLHSGLNVLVGLYFHIIIHIVYSTYIIILYL